MCYADFNILALAASLDSFLCCCCHFSIVAPLLLLVRDRLRRTFSCPRISFCALPAYWHTFSVAYAAVAVNLNESLDIHCDFLAKIALNVIIFINLVTELSNFFFCQILRARIGIYARLCAYIASAFKPKP